MILLFKQALSILTITERKRFFVQMVWSLLISITDIAALALLLVIINYYSGQQLPAVFSSLPYWLRQEGSLVLLYFFVALFIIKSIAGYYIIQAQYKYVYGVASRIAEANLIKHLSGPYLTFVQVDSAIAVHKIGQNSNEFSHHILSGFQQIITQLILVFLTTIVILLYNPQIFLLLFVLLLPPVVLLSFLLKAKLKTARAQIKVCGEKSQQYLQEALASYVESNLYNKKSFFAGRYTKYKKQLNAYLADVQVTQGTIGRLVEVFAILGLCILITINKVTGGSGIQLVTIGAFIAAAYKIIPGIVKVLNHSGQIKTYAFTINELKSVPVVASSTLNGNVGLHSIVFNNISFRFANRDVLKNISFDIKKGDFIGISGDSGKGKTTLVNLLLGFLEPDSGEIKFNGSSTDHHHRKNFWSKIAYVKQQPFLVHNTVSANITFNETHAEDERLVEAVLASGVHKMAGGITESLYKEVSEHGKNISGGQQRRITMARAFYKEADLIILDEPFNEIDEGSELEILAYCQQLAAKGKMILLITHNKKNFSFCNKLITLHG